jgi:lipoprotein-releasing system ATP-binding protein
MAFVVDHLGKDYPTRSGPLTILNDVSFALDPGDSLAVMGPSGSGKSTLLNICGTLDTPSRGSVKLDGLDPFAFVERELATFRNRRIGFIFQEHHLLPQCSVLENVLIPTLVAAEIDRAAVEKTARELIDRVGLTSRIEHRPAELSGGERQRAAIARSLILKPKLLLADEPTGNLDRKSAEGIAELLLELHKREQNILIVVTHSLDLAGRFPRRGEMNEGRLVVS